MPSFRGSSQPRNWAGISYTSCTCRWIILPLGPPGKGPIIKDNFSPERLICRAGQPLFTKHFYTHLPLNWISSPQYLSSLAEDDILLVTWTISGEGNGNPLQYSCLENSMDGGDWWPTVHGVASFPVYLPCIHWCQILLTAKIPWWPKGWPSLVAQRVNNLLAM